MGAMTARDVVAVALVGFAALGAILVHGRPLTWTHWMTHFAAIEALPVLVGLGIAGAFVEATRGQPRRAVWFVAGLSVVALSWPLVGASAQYRRRGRTFSIARWVGFDDLPPVAVKKDVALAPELPDLLADVYTGVGEGPRPFVLVIHGGSWRSGDKGEVPHASRAIAAAGITVFDLRYRLSGQARFPAAVADVKCALGKIRANASLFGIDPARSALLGRSAGAHLALLSGYSAGDARLPPTCGVDDAPVSKIVAIYPPTDLAWCHANPFVPDVGDGISAIAAWLGGTPAEVPDVYALASPTSHVRADAPPTLVVTGSGDGVVRSDNARFIADAFVKHGRKADVVVIPDAEHGFDVRNGGIGEQFSRQEILAFLADL